MMLVNSRYCPSGFPGKKWSRPQTMAPQTIAYELHGNCYLNLTSLCTLRCVFCPKFNKNWQVQGYHLKLRQEPNTSEVLDAIGNPDRYEEIVFCGLGEPTLRLPVLLDVAQQLKTSRVRIRINTDGLANLIYKKDVTPEFTGRIDALSVSLNAQDEYVYERLCRPTHPGTYRAMLAFIECARKHVPDITVTAIDGLPGVDIEACAQLAAEMGINFRHRVLDQVG